MKLVKVSLVAWRRLWSFRVEICDTPIYSQYFQYGWVLVWVAQCTMKGSFTLFCTDSFQRYTESIGWSPRLWQESTSNCLSTSSHCPMLWWKFIVFAVLALPKLAKLWISTKIGGPGHLESPNLATIWVCCWALLLFGCSYSHWCAAHSPLPRTPLYWTRNQ